MAQGALVPGDEPARERIYPPLSTLALDRLLDGLTTEATSFRQIEGRLAAGYLMEAPIPKQPMPT